MKNLKICKPNNFWIAIIIGIITATSVGASAQSHSFKVEKTGKGQDILFIPGLTCDGAVWDQAVSQLSKSYTCHVVTLPGFAGQKPIEVTNGFTPVIRTELIEYIQANKLIKPIIIGHSLGGFLALDIMSAEPDLIDRAIIVDGLPFFAAIQNPNATEESMKEASKNMSAMNNNMPPEQYAIQQRMILGAMITDSTNIETAFQWGAASDIATVNQAVYDMNTTDLRDDLAKIKSPVLVLGAYVAYKQYGVTKEMTMNNFANQFKELEGVKIELSDIGRHFIMWDDPQFFLNQTTAFLAK
ncbi:MAG: alpha/beta hydrolase [Cyclobacteriaceae bacterium]